MEYTYNTYISNILTGRVIDDNLNISVEYALKRGII